MQTDSSSDLVPLTAPLFGRLERVDLRTAWQREDADFTPWLARAENIRMLGDAIGFDLEVQAQEEAVGPFRADIVCRDTATGNSVLIENQLERTDHSHLGQLLTYAAGLSCVTIVWIAQRFTDEHRAALDWLNEKTEEGVNFFGLEIELWRIAESPVAPKFNIVSKPNGWTKSGGHASTGPNSGLTETTQTQRRYWERFAECAREKGTGLKFGSPQPRNSFPVAIGRTGFVLNAVASTWNMATDSYSGSEIRVELVLNDANAKLYFAALRRDQAAIEAEVAEPLIWYSVETVKSAKIVVRSDAPIWESDDWPRQHAWLLAKLQLLHDVFRPRIMKLDAGMPAAETPSSAE